MWKHPQQLQKVCCRKILCMSREWCELNAIYFSRFQKKKTFCVVSWIYWTFFYAFATLSNKNLLRMQNRRKFLIVEVFGDDNFEEWSSLQKQIEISCYIQYRRNIIVFHATIVNCSFNVMSTKLIKIYFQFPSNLISSKPVIYYEINPSLKGLSVSNFPPKKTINFHHRKNSH